MLRVESVADLMALTPAQKGLEGKSRYISFQQDILVKDNGSSRQMRPRTIEEAFAYQNFDLLRKGQLTIGTEIPMDLSDAYEEVYSHIKSSDFKKTDFAMAVLSGAFDWKVPDYITEGLTWLEARLHGPA